MEKDNSCRNKYGKMLGIQVQRTIKKGSAVLVNNLYDPKGWSKVAFIVGDRLNDCSIEKLCLK
jgi:hypothetical protein